MPLTARLVCSAAATLLIFSACGERAPEGDERAAGGDTTVQPDVAPGPSARPVVQDTSRWLEPAAVVHEARADLRPVLLTSVEAATHAGYDRITFEFATDGVPGYHVGYADEPIRECGSGADVAVTGTGRLVVRLEPAQAHDDQGQVTIQDRSRTPALPALEEMKLTCDFEAQVEWVLGVATPNAFRVTELADPPRLVIDVEHQP